MFAWLMRRRFEAGQFFYEGLRRVGSVAAWRVVVAVE